MHARRKHRRTLALLEEALIKVWEAVELVGAIH
jgi:ferric iron reductase protein FhuF